MKSDRVLEEIKERIDIVDFISGYVQLRKSGQNLKGLCPFHSEKTPSFMVSPSKQIYHCFGCGAGGDVISFLVNHDRLSFQEAVKELAVKAGIPLQSISQDSRAVEKSEQIRNALRDAALFYAEQLNGSGNAREYVRRRGINEESITAFRLGYAPHGWSNLLRRLKQSGYSEQTIKEAGLAVAGDKGPYDMFRERIIFPIMAVNGNIIAFGGRAMDDTLPKYINSPETVAFRKSETLYGLHAAKEAIRQHDKVLVVEGYMDVIICHQHGFRNVVAPLGTSLTDGHVRRLRKFTKDAVVVFDGDSAGIAAARRALPLFVQNDLNAKVLILPDSEDPDSYLRKHGSDAFSALVGSAMSAIDFVLSHTKGQRSMAVREALSLAACQPDALEAEQMLMELAGKTRISEAVLREEYKKLRLKQSGAPDKILPAKAGLKRISEEEILLSAVIAFPEKAGEVLSKIDLDEIRDGTVASLFRKIQAEKSSKGLPQNANEQERLLYTRLSVDAGFDKEFVDRNIEDCIRKIAEKRLEDRLNQARASNNVQLLSALLLEKKKLMKGMGHETR